MEERQDNALAVKCVEDVPEVAWARLVQTECFGLLDTKYTNGSSFKKGDGAAL